MAQKLVIDAFIQSFIGKTFKVELKEFKIDIELDLENQRIVNIDVARTRSEILTNEDRIELEKMLTYYCKKNKHTYKQGMNEILAPFMLLSRYGIPQHIQFSCYEMFIEKFLPTLFRDHHFRPLSGLFLISKLILLYHYPNIYLHFEKHQITPDMYMSSWFITMFASKIKNLDILYTFWYTLLQKGVSLYLSYFGVALLGFYQTQILAHNPSTLPLIFKDIKIKDFEEFKSIMSIAEELRSKMPQTAEWVLSKYEIFNLDKCEYYINLLHSLPCLTILPREIIKLIYPHELVCQCMTPKTCFMQNFNVILIDCRPIDDIKKGKLLNSQILYKSVNRNSIICNDIIKRREKLKNFVNKWNKVKNLYHFVIMDYNGSGQDRDVAEVVLKAFLESEFAYVSLVEGGFVACHDFLLQHNLPIIGHKEKTCSVCATEDHVCNFFEPLLLKNDLQKCSKSEKMLK